MKKTKKELRAEANAKISVEPSVPSDGIPTVREMLLEILEILKK